MEKKVAVVTGAASGIGYSVLNYLKKRDIDVVAVDIVNMKVFDDIFYHCDVSSEENVRATADIIENKVGRIDYLVLAAGILCVNTRLMITEMSADEWNGVLGVNLNGVMYCLKYFLPLMNNGGAVVTFSSEQTIRPIARSAPYLVSKTAVEALTKLAAIEMIEKKVRINCVRAATVDTNFLANYVKESDIRKRMRDDMDEKMSLGIISPDDIAHISWGLLSDENTKITGQVITVDGGILL